MKHDSDSPLNLVPVTCCVCSSDSAVEIGTGYDYEYRTSPDLFRAVQCEGCGTVFLNPRPDEVEFGRIYPDDYHTLEFSEENYSVVHKIRSRLEARRLLKYCRGLPSDARILDVGCGDGFHLRLLKEYGPPTWTIEGIDVDDRAVGIATASGLNVHLGTLDEVEFEDNTFDFVYTLQTLEHVARPDEFIEDIHRILKPGGRLVVVTDNTGSLDFRLFKNRYWGGYHFPRHWYLFNRSSLKVLVRAAGYEVEEVTTMVSPVNWVYSIHNMLVGMNAPRWLVNRFTLKAPVSLALFTMLDWVLQKVGRGALLNGYFIKPA